MSDQEPASADDRHPTAESTGEPSRGVRVANPYLSGNFGPVARELTATELTVRGRLPEALNGYFVRNGPNPVTVPKGNYSWFGGDGMLHIVEVEAGRVRSYRNRWVRTPAVTKALGEGPPSGPLSPTAADVSNTNTARLGSSLVSVTESALPYEIGFDGATVARTDLGGALSHGLSAHAKWDPVKGELHQIGYRANAAPYVVWQVIDATGRVTRTVPLDIATPVMIHTTTLTPKYLLVYDLPVVFSPAALGAGWSVPFAWDPSYQARLGVITRDTGAVQWIELPPLWVFHDGRSFDTPTGLSVDVAVYPQVFRKDLGGPLDEKPILESWDIDTVGGTVTRTVIDDRPQEFPGTATGQFGRPARYLYTVGAPSGSAAAALGAGNAVIRHDRVSGATTQWAAGSGRSTGEAVFVADPARAGAEDGGWLLCFVYDAATDRSSFDVLDAQDVAAGPVASVELPQRVPVGFHGNWYSNAQP
ncbi:MAG: carotenoid oxygenase family protein [Acidobacteriota bacterium]|nr:carotenoid oxygenase family protein [Acidobacteriota bacterium]